MRDGEEWVVNGQKVWNTLAHLADRGMLVARTDPELPKHKGLTYFMVDMHAPGVEVRPLRQITGEAEFNEVYLTDARIADADRIGAIGDGWRVSMTTLMNERTTIGAASSGGGTNSKRVSGIQEALDLWSRSRSPIATRSSATASRSCGSRAKCCATRTSAPAAKARAGNPGPEGSIAKLALASMNKATYELCIDLLGADGIVGYDYTFTRPDETGSRRRSDRRARCSCGPGRTRSRVAPRRSCATFSASASSASRASPASTATSPGPRSQGIAVSQFAVEGFRAERDSILTVAKGLTDEEWTRPSACAGWSTRDVMGHMACTLHGVVDPTVLPDRSQATNGAGADRDRTAELADRGRRRRIRDLRRAGRERVREFADRFTRRPMISMGDFGTHPMSILPSLYLFDVYTHLRNDILAPSGPIDRAESAPRRDAAPPHRRMDARPAPVDVRGRARPDRRPPAHPDPRRSR